VENVTQRFNARGGEYAAAARLLNAAYLLRDGEAIYDAAREIGELNRENFDLLKAAAGLVANAGDHPIVLTHALLAWSQVVGGVASQVVLARAAQSAVDQDGITGEAGRKARNRKAKAGHGEGGTGDSMRPKEVATLTPDVAAAFAQLQVLYGVKDRADVATLYKSGCVYTTVNGKTFRCAAQSFEGAEQRFNFEGYCVRDALTGRTMQALPGHQEWFKHETEQKDAVRVADLQAMGRLCALVLESRAEAAIGTSPHAVQTAVGVLECHHEGGADSTTITAVSADCAIVAVDCGLALRAAGTVKGEATGVAQFGNVRYEFQVRDLVPWANNPNVWCVKLAPPLQGVRKVPVAAPTKGGLSILRTAKETTAGMVGECVGKQALTHAGVTKVYPEVWTHHASSIDGDCGSLLSQGRGQAIGVHIGTGFGPDGKAVNFFLALT
jgi:hypothetical protein